MWVGMRTFLVAPHKIVSIRGNISALLVAHFRFSGASGGRTNIGWESKVYRVCMGNMPAPFNIPLIFKEVFELIRPCLKNQSNL